MVKKLHATATPAAQNGAAKAAKARKPRAGSGKAGKAATATKAGSMADTMAGMVQDSALATSVKDSAEHIWLAGMGAFSKVQAEGGKVFEALVKEGQNLQRKTQAAAEETIGEVAGRMTAMAGTVQAKAGQNWDKLEGIFEARTAKAMTKLGVPTAKDVQALIKRVDELAAAVAKLSRQVAGQTASAAAGTPAKAPARKRATARAAAAPAVAPQPAAKKRAVRKVARKAAAQAAA